MDVSNIYIKIDLRKFRKRNYLTIYTIITKMCFIIIIIMEYLNC